MKIISEKIKPINVVRKNSIVDVTIIGILFSTFLIENRGEMASDTRKLAIKCKNK
ncbi:hypothetical protein DSN97_09195 [Deferribacteraceae bacterium V6Fe1]|nr:hypothetical protein DSN97_09195 [Deferribacteraceae bacterium V6Fe1]